MYKDYWGLKENPFRNVLDSRYWFASKAHEEALARLCFLVEENRRGGLLLGDIGSGKSLVLQMFAQEMARSRRRFAMVGSPAFDGRELLYDLAGQFGLAPRPADSRADLWRQLSSFVKENRYQDLHTVIVVDDAHMITEAPMLTDCRLLFNLDEDPQARLTVIFSGQPKFTQMVRHDASLMQLFDLSFTMEPLSTEECTQYVGHRLDLAGRTDPVFDEGALSKIHDLSRGLPRQINHLCDLAMLSACDQQVDRIDAAVVEGVYNELSTEATVHRANRETRY